MSNSQSHSRSRPRMNSLKHPTIKIMCPIHNQQIHRVDTVSKSMMCLVCEESDYKPNLETERVKATNLFKDFVKSFRATNEELEKTISMFKQSNIHELKRKVKGTLPQVQALIDAKMEQLIHKGNLRIQRQVEKELQQWDFLDNDQITSLSEMNKMLNYKEIYQDSRVVLETLKTEIKAEISTEIKKLVRQYYQANLKV